VTDSESRVFPMTCLAQPAASSNSHPRRENDRLHRQTISFLRDHNPSDEANTAVMSVPKLLRRRFELGGLAVSGRSCVTNGPRTLKALNDITETFLAGEHAFPPMSPNFGLGLPLNALH